MGPADPVAHRRRPARLAAAALVLLAAAGVARAEPDPALVAEALRRATETLTSVGRHEVAGQWVLSSRTLPSLYARAGFRLLWPRPGAAEALLGEVAASEGDGLSPDDYHFSILIATMERRRAGPDDVQAAVDADLLLTDALVRLVAHLRLGKVDPAGRPRWDLPERVGPLDAVETVEGLLASGQLSGRLADLRPAQPLYGRLKAALARYRIIAADSGWPSIGPGPVLSPGMTDTRVATVRRRLALTGDFFGELSDSPAYDPAVTAAVQNFQRRHGLETDGLLGPATRQAMNRAVEARIDEIRANLERARQLLADVRGRYLLVDPAAGQVVSASDGSATDTQAADFGPGILDVPPFRAELSYVVVNPDWTLPPSIVQRQVVPLARRAPGRLEAAGMSVLTADGRRVDPRRADWSAPGRLVVRQSPGESSFLGSARLAFPNPSGVTVHGRGAGGAAIPGSVAVPDPLALAGGVLGPGTDRASLDELAGSGRTRTFPVQVPVAVVFSPWTAWAGTDGSVSFRRGFEAADAALVAGLDAPARP